ncbi:MAG TPA: ChaN family lipoprotein, partial [Gammaproteobacteria bacterium]|nr:ChaN family lipoprotein [Gammaproteobacteria bacterium]
MTPQRGRAAVAAMLGAVLGLLAGPAAMAGGSIIRLATGHSVPFQRMIDDLAGADVVLVGERHDDHAQHWVQNQVLTGLRGRGPVAVGMEAFPSGRDRALDDWRRGRIPSWPRFLVSTDWFGFWGIAPDLYRPILETVRRHRLPLAGLNGADALPLGRFQAVQ